MVDTSQLDSISGIWQLLNVFIYTIAIDLWTDLTFELIFLLQLCTYLVDWISSFTTPCICKWRDFRVNRQINKCNSTSSFLVDLHQTADLIWFRLCKCNFFSIGYLRPHVPITQIKKLTAITFSRYIYTSCRWNRDHLHTTVDINFLFRDWYRWQLV